MINSVLFVCVKLRLNVPVNNFSVTSRRSQRFLGLTSTVGSCSRTQHDVACGEGKQSVAKALLQIGIYASLDQ